VTDSAAVAGINKMSNTYVYYTFMTAALCSNLHAPFSGLNEVAVFVEYLEINK